MFQQSLHDNWQFFASETAGWLPAQVPGCVHTDLLSHALIPDPFYGRNEFDLQWIEEKDWSYRMTFVPSTEILSHENVELVFEGLDTVATVRLNGEEILRSENMFHRHRVEVKQKLQAGENTLEIEFGSALQYIREHRDGFETREFNDPLGGCTVIRKQQCQFGWDWGPRFVTCGIWRPLYMEGWSGNRIESVFIRQDHAGNVVRLSLDVETAAATDDVFQVNVSLDGKAVATATGGAHDLACEIRDPQLWWPSGQGEQPLYQVTVSLLEGEETVFSWQRRIGLRTIVLDTEPDEYQVTDRNGVSLNRFGLRVNGRLIFAKGANWIPAHSFVAGLTRDDYEPLLLSAKAANMNIMRLWGGGVYEHDAFYDCCDEMGLLVWHDFMFACTLCPAGDEFLASVGREARDQVKRIRHHSCVALWCGNNELVALNKDLLEDEKRRQEYVRLFLETLPQALEEVAPGATYIHTSPLHTIPGMPETEMPSHDEHDWSVWHELAPVEYYETTRHRFNSEFGMQSYPSPRIASTFCPPEELNILSPTFEAHQKHGGGNAIIFNYCAQQYRFPKDYRSISYLSQLNQAYCMKMAIEHFRRSQPQCLGAMYWQLNDCWPVASWSSLEFGGGWKAIHHYARRFFAPALVSVRLLGEDIGHTGNRRRNTRGEVELWTSYDAPQERPVRLSWQLMTLAGERVEEDGIEVVLRYGESRLWRTVDFTSQLESTGKANAVLRVELSDAVSGEVLSANTALFVGPRYLDLSKAAIQLEEGHSLAGQRQITLCSSAFHYGVQFEEPEGFRFSDNFFDLYPGIPRTVTLELGAMEARKAGAEWQDCPLSVFSLADTFESL